jgi:tetratricopeptide (TPR) repeat protein
MEPPEMSAESRTEDDSLSLSLARQVDEVCDRFEQDFRQGLAPRIEACLDAWPGDASGRAALLRALLGLELELRRQRGESPSAVEYAGRFPDDRETVAAVFANAATRGARRRVRHAVSRSLLLGVLALRLNFVRRDDLLAALQAWIADGAQTLASVLAHRGAIGAERIALLEALVAEELQQHAGDAETSLAGAVAQEPSYDFLFALDDGAVKASLDQARARAHSVASTVTTVTDGAPHPPAGRYRSKRFYRGGGLGDIYIADDLELGREVALKEIKPTLADDPGSRSRFVFEAEVTGGLEHPNIVPVYGRGEYDNGRPYYAMRFIKGDNLQDAIRRFHAADGPDRNPSERALALRELLGRFLDVGDAVEYAHARRVLHRDLKPGNILLGRFGETLVVDWGLAKLLDHDRARASGAAEEPTFHPSSRDDFAETLAGHEIGTIGYMAPEQALGRLDELGPASDVYSLGAILYALLTGKASIRSGDDRAAAIETITSGRFPRPRAVNPRVPRALESICLKAMATDPAARYASPGALTDDVKHWLADEPVAAHPEWWYERLGRWSRRHRAWTRAAAAALALVTLVASTAAVLVARAYQSERKALARSEADFNTAREGVIETYKVASRELAGLSNSEAVRERLARQVVATYEGLIRSRPGERSLAYAAALADRELGHVRRLLGAYGAAAEDDARAVGRLRSLLASDPGDDMARNELAYVLADTGALEDTRGHPDRALAALRESLEQVEVLRKKAPDDLRFMRSQAYALLQLATLQIDTGAFAEAERAGTRALGLWQAIVASPRSNAATDPLFVTKTQVQIAAARRELGDRTGARKMLQAALDAASHRADEHPGNSDTQVALASVRISLGDFLVETDPAAAASLFRSATQELRRVASFRPRVPQFRLDLAVAHRGMGTAQRALGQLDPAAKSCAEARRLLLVLLKERDIPGYHYSLGRVLAEEARIARARKKPTDARALYAIAIAQHELALEVDHQSVFDTRHRDRCRKELQELEAPPAAAPATGQSGEEQGSAATRSTGIGSIVSSGGVSSVKLSVSGIGSDSSGRPKAPASVNVVSR